MKMERLTTTLFALLLLFVSKAVSTSQKLDMGPVWVSVSSLEDKHYPTERKLQIHWDSTVSKVALFTQDPATGASPVVWVNNTGTGAGMLETDVVMGAAPLPGGWERLGSGQINDQAIPGEHCLQAWVAAYEGEKVSYIDCLRIRPTWMYDKRLALGGLDLASLFIPGTHNSGCYKRGYRSLVGHYILTQDQDIWTQLVHGIRYLDLRVGYYSVRKNGTEQPCDQSCFWINHDLIKVRPLFGVINEIKDFIETAEGEILILDFHRFPVGFNGRAGRHDLLVDLLQEELGRFAIPPLGSSMTLDSIWQQKKRIIIAYGHNDTVQENNWLWPALRQMWGNVQRSEDLKDYLEACTAGGQYGGIWAAMAHLTPIPIDVLLRSRGGLRPLAHSVGPNLTSWAKPSWWSRANIVATDFFLETDIVSMALAANLMKGYQQKHYLLV